MVRGISFYYTIYILYHLYYILYHIYCIFYYTICTLVANIVYHHVILQLMLIGGKVGKGFRKTAKGALKNEGKLQFRELSDKGYSTTVILSTQ